MNLARWGGTAAVVVMLIATLDWVGWATGVEGMTRVYRSWPPMTPWTGLWLAGLGAAILVQSGPPSRGRVWVGRGVAVVVAATAVLVLAEYVSGRAVGLDQVWFGHLSESGAETADNSSAISHSTPPATTNHAE